MLRKHIFIGAHARSGSTYLCNTLSLFDNLKVYLELFHYDLRSIESYLGAERKEVKALIESLAGHSPLRSDYIAWADEYISYLREKHHQFNVAFKVFPGHLPLDQLRILLDKSLVVILLRRNLLHSYISTAIANRLKIYSRFDTSNEFIVFSKNEFIAHVRDIHLYYRYIDNFATNNNIPLVYIDYEDVCMSADPCDFIKNKLQSAIGDLRQSTQAVTLIEKQDRRLIASDKVINKDEMISFLRTYELDFLDDGSLNCPYDVFLQLLESIYAYQ